MTIASLIAGTVVVETAFGLDGLGSLLVQSVTENDFAVAQAICLILVVAFIVVNGIVDALYAVRRSPRPRSRASHHSGPYTAHRYPRLADQSSPAPGRRAASPFGVLVLAVLIAVAAPLIAPHDPNAVDFAHVFSGPSRQHLLGTDDDRA